MTVSYIDNNRRGDLRAAALFVIDGERQRTGYDKRIPGSAGVPDVIRTFDEMLTVFPLESEVGQAISAADEIPCWEAVRDAMEPIWKLWPSFSCDPGALVDTSEWASMREAVERCVDRHRLWHEEIEYPMTVVFAGAPSRIDAWSELEQLDPSLIGDLTDVRGRPIELERRSHPISVKRVGLPPLINT